MAQQVRRFDRYGRELSDDSTIPDGGHVRVALPFMDHLSVEMRRALSLMDCGGDGGIVDGMGHLAGHRPGFCYGSAPSHDKANEARDGYLRRISDAWKHPQEVKVPPPRSRSNTHDAQSAHDRYVQRIANAWR
jgi:hypothetical protein